MIFTCLEVSIYRLKKTYVESKSDFSRPRLDASLGRPDGQLCNCLSIMRFKLSILRPRLDGCNSAAGNFHNKDYFRTMFPWRPNGCNSSPCLALSRTSSGRMQLSFHIRVCEGKPNSSWTLMCVWTCCHGIWTDVRWSTENLLDTDGHPNARLGRPDGNFGSDFSELESVQNLPWTSWNTFMKWRLWINGIPD
jgi:hypothetical protein